MPVIIDGTNGITYNDSTTQSSNTLPLFGVTASSSGSLTVTLSAGQVNFRNPTLTTGTPITVSIGSSISCVVPSSATLGTVSGVQTRLAVIAYYNNGTPVLGIINTAGGNSLDETGTVTPTLIGASSNNNNVFYCSTTIAATSYRIVGYVDVTYSGSWGNPVLVQSAFGQMTSPMAGLGYGQTWQNVTGSRALGTTYYNTTGKPIQLSIYYIQSSTGNISLTVSGNVIGGGSQQNVSGGQNLTHIIPPGTSYMLTGVSNYINTWYELRNFVN